MAQMGLFLCIATLLCFATAAVHARIPGVYTGGPWQSAHATFYGDSDASRTMGCLEIRRSLWIWEPVQPGIWNDHWSSEHGTIHHGLSCGACFELNCADDP